MQSTKTLVIETENSRWNAAQLKEDAFWKRTGVLDSEMRRVLSRYVPVIEEVSKGLDPNCNILDVGCGPTCVGQFFTVGTKTYIDPLMDSYLKTYSERLPEGEKICGVAEDIPKEDESFDVVICINALDHMDNPVKALSEMHRVLKKEGMFLLGIFLHPSLIAAARGVIEKWLPFFREEAHPYSFTLKSIREFLKPFFFIEREIRVFRKDSALIPSLHREDWMFICRKVVKTS